MDSLQSLQRLLRLVFLEMDARETERGFIADDVVDVRFQHRLDGAPGAMMHAVVELEVADIEFRGGEVVVERVALRLVDAPMLRQLRVEPLERFEIAALRRLENRFPEVQVLQVIRRRRTRSQRGGQRQREQHVTRTGHRSPVPDVDCGLARVGPGKCDAHQLGFDGFREGELLAVGVVLAVRELAVQRNLDGMLAGGDVAGVDALDAALLQCLEFLEAVDVVAAGWPSIRICTASSRSVSPLESATKTARCESDGYSSRSWSWFSSAAIDSTSDLTSWTCSSRPFICCR